MKNITAILSLLSLRTPAGLAPNELNSGSFSSGDYTPSGGLTGNGTSRILQRQNGWSGTVSYPDVGPVQSITNSSGAAAVAIGRAFVQ